MQERNGYDSPRESSEVQPDRAEQTGGAFGLTVRAARVDDLVDIVSFQLAMAEETEGKQLERARVERGVRAVFDSPALGRYLVACSGAGDVLGSLLLTSEWSDWRAQTFWWIQSVYVRASGRGRGAFRALYEHVLAEARADGGVCGVRLYVDHDNHAAQEVYRRVGMAESHYRFFEVDFVLGSPSA